MMVYNNTPAAVLALKKSGIQTPADLNGRKLGAPVFDAGRKAFPILEKANRIGNVAWTAMEPALRETMLVRGDVDAITGFSFTSLLNLEARGVRPRHRRAALCRPWREALRQRDHRRPGLPEEVEPGCGQGLPVGLRQGREGGHGGSEGRDRMVKARDGIINTDLELRRLKLAIDASVRQP